MSNEQLPDPPAMQEVERFLMEAAEDVHNPLTMPEALERLSFYKKAWLGGRAVRATQSEEE